LFSDAAFQRPAQPHALGAKEFRKHRRAWRGRAMRLGSFSDRMDMGAAKLASMAKSGITSGTI
jgi:hypothetical protein